MSLIKWMRPSGNEIETRDTDEIREYASEQGWKEVKPRGRKPKKADPVTTEAVVDGDSD